MCIFPIMYSEINILMLNVNFVQDSRCPYAPKVLNNVGFAYLTVACINSATFAANLPLFFGVYIVGSLVFNGGCVLLMKPARYLAARSIKNDVKADA